MRRRLFTILSALSLLLCVAVVVMWVRSVYASDRMIRVVQRTGPNQEWAHQTIVGSESGYVYVATIHSEMGHLIDLNFGPEWTYRAYEARRPFWLDWSTIKPPYGTSERWGGTAAGMTRMSRPHRFGTAHGRAWWVHYSSVATASAVLPIAWVAAHVLRRRRESRGLCRRCGYDLRASPDRCPECGTAPAKASA